jgi:predicted MFS family arabinose efflux permease
MLFSGAAGLVLVMLAFSPSLALAIALVLGVLIGPPPGAIMAMPGRVLRPENRAVGLGLFMTAYNIVTAVGPTAAGALKDGFGAGAPLVFGGAVFISVVPLTVLYRALSRPIVPEAPERVTAGVEQPRAG